MAVQAHAPFPKPISRVVLFFFPDLQQGHAPLQGLPGFLRRNSSSLNPVLSVIKYRLVSSFFISDLLPVIYRSISASPTVEAYPSDSPESCRCRGPFPPAARRCPSSTQAVTAASISGCTEEIWPLSQRPKHAARSGDPGEAWVAVFTWTRRLPSVIISTLPLAGSLCGTPLPAPWPCDPGSVRPAPRPRHGGAVVSRYRAWISDCPPMTAGVASAQLADTPPALSSATPTASRRTGMCLFWAVRRTGA